MAIPELSEEFREFLKSLNSEKVRYLIVGGYAVNFYGYHRSTEDMDVWIAVDSDNATKLSMVLQRFAGFPASQVRPSIFKQMGQIFRFGRVPFRIDVLTNPSGISFQECYARRQQTDL